MRGGGGRLYRPGAQSALGEPGLGGIFAAVHPDGTQSLLSVTDCSRDSTLDVSIPGSGSDALRKARMVFSANICQGQAPQSVEVTLMTPVARHVVRAPGMTPGPSSIRPPW